MIPNILIGMGMALVIGLIGGFLLKEKLANAIWLAPAIGVVGAALLSVLASITGEPSYGWKEITAHVVIAIGSVAAVGFLATRQSATSEAAASK